MNRSSTRQQDGPTVRRNYLPIAIAYSPGQIIHRVSKNVPPLTCYSLDRHNPITMIFGRSVTEKAENQTMLCFPTSSV